MALAYPDAAYSMMGEVHAKEAFVAALGDDRLARKIADREAKDLDSALKVALRCEANDKAYELQRNKESRDTGRGKG